MSYIVHYTYTLSRDINISLMKKMSWSQDTLTTKE